MVRTRSGLGILAMAVALSLGLATVAAAGTETNPNLVRNGSFERPEVVTPPFDTFDQGETIGPWVVTLGSVDLLRAPTWEAAHKEQSLDLSGEEAGAIRQRIEGLTVGATYVLRFAIAGNADPKCRAADPESPEVKRLAVYWGGQLIAILTHDTADQTPAEVDWLYREFEVIARTRNAWLRFASRTPGPCGPLLDHVSLVAAETAA
jgi:hypothetical protein